MMKQALAFVLVTLCALSGQAVADKNTEDTEQKREFPISVCSVRSVAQLFCT